MPKLLQNHLTVRRIEAETRPGLHADGGGLYLHVRPGSKTWIFRYAFAGRRRDMGFGPVRDVPLREARDLAYEARRQVRAGSDPLIERHGEKAAVQEARAEQHTAKHTTVEEAVRTYVQAKKGGWSPLYTSMWDSSMRLYVEPVIGKLPVHKISTEIVLQIIEPLWLTKPRLAQDLRIRLNGMLKFAIAKNWHKGPNPAAMDNLGVFLSATPKSVERPMLDYKELPAFMRELRASNHVGRDLLEFIILTGARLDEARCLPWRELKLADRWWVCPPERMKEGEEHRVPLSTAAMAVIERMQAIRQNRYVFAGPRVDILNKGAADKTLKFLRRGVTVHGFRSTFATWAGEETDYEDAMIEISIAHAVGNEVRRRYQRGDKLAKRARLMEDWAAYCAG